MVAFELLSFERPFRSTTPAALVYDIAHGETPRLPAGLPAPLVAWVGRAMDRDPQRRFADASIAREALQEAMRGLAGPGRTGSNSRRMVGPQRNRRRVPIFAGAIAAAAFIAVLAWFASTRSSGREDQTATGSLPAAPVAVSDPSGPSGSPTPEPVPTSVAEVVPNVWARFDAQPWGTVTEVVDRTGRALELPSDRRTPLALSEVPATWWRASILGPNGTTRHCELDLAKGSATCRVVFQRPEVRSFLERQP